MPEKTHGFDLLKLPGFKMEKDFAVSCICTKYTSKLLEGHDQRR
jgi:hypothetical protein